MSPYSSPDPLISPTLCRSWPEGPLQPLWSPNELDHLLPSLWGIWQNSSCHSQVWGGLDPHRGHVPTSLSKPMAFHHFCQKIEQNPALFLELFWAIKEKVIMPYFFPRTFCAHFNSGIQSISARKPLCFSYSASIDTV